MNFVDVADKATKLLTELDGLIDGAAELGIPDAALVKPIADLLTMLAQKANALAQGKLKPATATVQAADAAADAAEDVRFPKG